MMTRDSLEGRLKMLFGGRVAEEMVFGHGKITTGAGNDIERATDLARRMVTQFGMSDAIGPVSIGERDHEVFLGRDISHRRETSEKTAELVDTEIKRILESSYDAAKSVIGENRQLLEAMAESLLVRETLDSSDIALLEQGRPLPPLEVSPPPATPELPAPEPAPARDRPIEGAGGEPAPAPA
jgi:cell division protease FtsH